MATEINFEECLTLLISTSSDIMGNVISALTRIVDNVLYRFDDVKNRTLYISSDVMMNLILPTEGAIELLFSLGFQEEDDKLVLHDLTKIDLLIACKMNFVNIKDWSAEHPNSESDPSNESEENLRLELKKQFRQMEFFEFPELHRRAKQLIPLEKLNQEALEKYNSFHSSDTSIQLKDCLLMCLMAWFKEDFFSWYDTGFCEICRQTMEVASPSTERCNRQERLALCVRTELYKCPRCSTTERFPRYFYPGSLLFTRKGRCMEWASCFMLMCRSLDFETRYILDKTDHVWNEIYFESEKRWVHVDPCENKMDSPLMYEKGWKKDLSYVYVFSLNEIRDCVWKYSAQHEAVGQRRSQYSEKFLAATIQSLNDYKQSKLNQELKNTINMRAVKEIVQSMKPPSTEGQFEGRSSGSLSWRLARGDTTFMETNFVFTPNAAEVEALEMIVEYSITRDSYYRKGEDTRIWNTCVYSSKNIFRKHEKDWRNFYLARIEGSDEGEICWKFNWSHSNMKLQSMLVQFSHSTFENGCVHWQLCSKDFCIPGNSNGKLKLTSADVPDGVTEIDLKCHISGGKGDVSWQHAQIFRQNETQAHTFPFIVHLNFE